MPRGDTTRRRSADIHRALRGATGAIHPMNPQLLLALASLAAAAPPIVDEAIKARVSSPRMLALFTMLVGLLFAAVTGGLTSKAQGATTKDALSVAFVGLVSGVAAGVVNWYRAGGAGGSSDGSISSSSGASSAPNGAAPSNNTLQFEGNAHLFRAARNWGIGAAIAGFVVILTSGCALLGAGASSPTDAEPPTRAEVRARMVAVAYGLGIADQACAIAAQTIASHGDQSTAITVAATCADGYTTVRAALIVAQTELDAWNDGSAGRVACAAQKAVTGLKAMEDTITSRFTLPANVATAMADVLDTAGKLAAFAGVCVEPDAGSDAAPRASAPGTTACSETSCVVGALR
jgi:hypothetical protein